MNNSVLAKVLDPTSFDNFEPNLEESEALLNKNFYETVTYNSVCTVSLGSYLLLCSSCPDDWQQSLEFTDNPRILGFDSSITSKVLSALRNGHKVLQPVLIYVGDQ